jgi:hypothetical protein
VSVNVKKVIQVSANLCMKITKKHANYKKGIQSIALGCIMNNFFLLPTVTVS